MQRLHYGDHLKKNTLLQSINFKVFRYIIPLSLYVFHAICKYMYRRSVTSGFLDSIHPLVMVSNLYGIGITSPL